MKNVFIPVHICIAQDLSKTLNRKLNVSAKKTAMEPSCLYNLWLNRLKLLLLQEKVLYGVFAVKIRVYIQP